MYNKLHAIVKTDREDFAEQFDADFMNYVNQIEQSSNSKNMVKSRKFAIFAANDLDLIWIYIDCIANLFWNKTMHENKFS